MKRNSKEQQEKENIIPIGLKFPSGRSRSKSNQTQYSTPIMQNNQNYLYDQQLQQFNDQLHLIKQQEYSYFQNDDNLKSFVRYPKSSRGEQVQTSQKQNTLGSVIRSDIQDLKQLKSFLLENDLGEKSKIDKGRDNQSEQNVSTTSNTITLPSTSTVVDGISIKNQSDISCYLEKLTQNKESTNINTIQKSTISQNKSYLPECKNVITKQTTINDKSTTAKDKPERRNNSKPPTRQNGYLADLENYQTINHEINVMNIPSSMSCHCDLPNKTQSALSDTTNIPTFREIIFCQNHCQFQKGVNIKNKQQSSQSTQHSNSSQSQRRQLVQRNGINNQHNIKQKNILNEIENQSNSVKTNQIQQKRVSQPKKRESSQTQQNEQSLLEVSIFSFLQNPINTQCTTQTNQLGRMQSKSVFSVSKDIHNNVSNQNQQSIHQKVIAQQSEERKNFNKTIHNVLLNFKAMQLQQQRALNFPDTAYSKQPTQQQMVQQQQINQASKNIREVNQNCFNDNIQQQQQKQLVINSYQSYNSNISYETNFTNDKQKISLPSIHNTTKNSKNGRSLSLNGNNNTNKLNKNINNNKQFDCIQDNQTNNTSLYKIFN